MEWYEQEVRALEAMLAEADGGPSPTVFYGSSSIRMWETLVEDVGWPVLNAGFGGSTMEACAHFFGRLVTPLHPGSLVVYAGDNDLGDGRPPGHVLESFLALMEKVDSSLNGVRFGFISIKPSPARVSLLDRIERTNELIRGEVERRAAAYYVDVYPAMLGPHGEPRPELFLDDGLHLSRAGYRLWGELLRPYRHLLFTGSSL